jgi:cytochrome c553
VLNRLYRLLGYAALFVVALAIALFVHGWGLVHRAETRGATPLRVTPDSTMRERGRHLAEITCAECHSPDGHLPLTGGPTNFLADAEVRGLGDLYAGNLTPAGALARYPTDAELGRAIREGIAPGGRPLVVMPSEQYYAMSDPDLAALIAYLRSQPPAATPGRPRRFAPLSYLVLGAQAVETSVQRQIPSTGIPTIPPGINSEYGYYLVNLLGCRSCHGDSLRGGRAPFYPKGPDLAAFVTHRPIQAFDLAVRRGVGSGATRLDPQGMPWPIYQRLTNAELAAVYVAIQHPPVARAPGPDSTRRTR